MTVEAANKELLAAAHDGKLDRVKAAHASGADINHLSVFPCRRVCCLPYPRHSVNTGLRDPG